MGTPHAYPPQHFAAARSRNAFSATVLVVFIATVVGCIGILIWDGGGGPTTASPSGPFGPSGNDVTSDYGMTEGQPSSNGGTRTGIDTDAPPPPMFDPSLLRPLAGSDVPHEGGVLYAWSVAGDWRSIRDGYLGSFPVMNWKLDPQPRGYTENGDTGVRIAERFDVVPTNGAYSMGGELDFAEDPNDPLMTIVSYSPSP